MAAAKSRRRSSAVQLGQSIGLLPENPTFACQYIGFTDMGSDSSDGGSYHDALVSDLITTSKFPRPRCVTKVMTSTDDGRACPRLELRVTTVGGHGGGSNHTDVQYITIPIQTIRECGIHSGVESVVYLVYRPKDSTSKRILAMRAKNKVQAKRLTREVSSRFFPEEESEQPNSTEPKRSVFYRVQRQATRITKLFDFEGFPASELLDNAGEEHDDGDRKV